MIKELTETELKGLATGLIPDAGEKSGVDIERISGSGNNRSYKISTGAGKYLLKHYFRHKNDQRDRLKAEFDFSSFAWCHGVRTIAEPVAKDDDLSVGIYGFIEGRKFGPGDIGGKEVGQAADFFCRINSDRLGARDAGLPDASEACFSIEEHIGVIDGRLARLKGIIVADDADREAQRFINNNLSGVWESVKERVLAGAGDYGIPLGGKISAEESVLSPSDFGFHNAIMGANGAVSFIDFEYAGWDDPAKMVGDFFSQVAVPVPMDYFASFVDSILGCLAGREKALARIRLLLPLYRIKWCCIVLNHFLPVDKERKRFAAGDGTCRKQEQLEKAKKVLDSLNPDELDKYLH